MGNEGMGTNMLLRLSSSLSFRALGRCGMQGGARHGLYCIL